MVFRDVDLLRTSLPLARFHIQTNKIGKEPDFPNQNHARLWVFPAPNQLGGFHHDVFDYLRESVRQASRNYRHHACHLHLFLVDRCDCKQRQIHKEKRLRVFVRQARQPYERKRFFGDANQHHACNVRRRGSIIAEHCFAAFKRRSFAVYYRSRPSYDTKSKFRFEEL